ncbi:hypothetical protein EDB87DRAFT_1580838 [Lactarius vividus]|nr:hypothetical protein EDB87DRAFT_1580838 [Lactarius vividus]
MPPPPTPCSSCCAPATTPVPASTPRAKKQPHAKTPTPAAALSAKAPTPTPPAKPTPPPRSSFASAVKLPARPSLVMTPRHAVGSPAPIAVCRNPQELVAHLNSILLEGGHSVTLSAARWTAKANLVLTAGPDTTAHHLNAASHIISEALAVYLSADTTSPLPVLARENCKWGRLTINGIPTGASLTCGPYSPSELHAALLADNPAYRMLRLTQAPSWGSHGRPDPLRLQALWGVEAVEGKTRGQAIGSPFSLTPTTFFNSCTQFSHLYPVYSVHRPHFPTFIPNVPWPLWEGPPYNTAAASIYITFLFYVDWVPTYSRPYCIELLIWP